MSLAPLRHSSDGAPDAGRESSSDDQGIFTTAYQTRSATASTASAVRAKRR